MDRGSFSHFRDPKIDPLAGLSFYIETKSCHLVVGNTPTGRLLEPERHLQRINGQKREYIVRSRLRTIVVIR